MKEISHARDTSPTLNRSWPTLSILDHVKRQRWNDGPSTKTPKISKRIVDDYFPVKVKMFWDIKEVRLWVFNPDHTLRVLWDALMLVIIIFQSIMIPFSLSFDPMLDAVIWNVILYTEMLFYLDIAIQFNTAYYCNGNYVTERKKISINYLKSWFTLDLCTTISNFTYLYDRSYIPSTGYLRLQRDSNQAIKLMWLSKLLRIFKVKKIIYLIEDSLANSRFIPFVQIFKFFLVAVIWGHWVSCITQGFYDEALISNGDLWSTHTHKIENAYLLKVFYAVMTMTSTGYGSFFIHSTPQMMNAMTTMFFECFLFGYLVGNIQTIIKKNNAENNYYEAIITQIKKYMSTKRIPKSLRSRVIQYIYYLRNISKNRFNEEEILSCLSSQMKDDIYVHTRGRSLESCPAFKVYPNTFIRALGRKLLIEVHAPGDLIFKEGEMSNSIYFIQSGTVEIYHENTKTVFRELRKGKYFGEISFFMGTTRSASARSLMYGEILSLSGNALSRLLISRPKEKEITELLISECLKDLSALGVRCYLCTVLGHVASDCEAYKYKLDKQKIAWGLDTDKYKMGKKFNMNNSFGRKIQRKAKKVDPFMNYTIQNVQGSSNHVFLKDSLSLMAVNFGVEKDLSTLNDTKLAFIEDESGLEEPEFSILPSSMQYRQMFLENSWRRRNMKPIAIDIPEISLEPALER